MTDKEQTLVILDYGDCPAVYKYTKENDRALLVATLESRSDLYDYKERNLGEISYILGTLKRKNVNLELLLDDSVERLDVKDYVQKVIVAIRVLDQDSRLSVDYIREVL